MPRPSPSTHSRPARSRIVFPFPPLPEDSPIQAQVQRITTSRTFSGAYRSQHFLRYILQHSLTRPDEHLKEYSIAIDVFQRDSSYDPAVNNTVRVEAGRLRSRLLEYYSVEGNADTLIIEVPKGSYRVLIHDRTDCQNEPPVAPPAAAHCSSPAITRRQRITAAPRSPLLTVSLAFLIGALFGYRVSR